MPRDKSIDSEKTSSAVKHYYDVAKEKGLLDPLLKAGGFQVQAIEATIRRGKISTKMIDTFKGVLNVDPAVLTGEKELPAEEPTTKFAISANEINLPFAERTLDLLTALLAVQKISDNPEFQNELNEIKLSIARLAHSILPGKTSIDQYVASTNMIGNQIIEPMIQGDYKKTAPTLEMSDKECSNTNL